MDYDGDDVPCNVDCNDYDQNMFPGNPEICDGLDNDCNPDTSDCDQTSISICTIEYPGNCEGMQYPIDMYSCNPEQTHCVEQQQEELVCCDHIEGGGCADPVTITQCDAMGGVPSTPEWEYFCDQTCMHDFINKHFQEFVRLHPRTECLETPINVTKNPDDYYYRTKIEVDESRNTG